MLTEYHVPLVFYAPGLIKKAKVISTTASEVDLLPSIASLAGFTFTNTTFGRDLFNQQFDDKRYAFTFERSRPPVLGLIGDEYYFKMRVGGADKELYKIHSTKPKENLTTHQPELTEELATLTQAYYESIRYVRFNNGANNFTHRNKQFGLNAGSPELKTVHATD